MRRLVRLVVAVLVLGSFAPTAAGQGTTPASSPAAAACIAPPLASDTREARRGTSGATDAEPATAIAPGSEAPLEPRTPPPGTPAGTELLERIRAAEENIANCFNAGDYLAFTSLFTPRALRDELGMSDPRATPAHSASYVILREAILSVRDAQTHADGRVSAEVVFAFEGFHMRARDIFVEQDGRLLLDEVFELPLADAPAATPAPIDAAILPALTMAGFRPEDEPSVVMIGSLGNAIGMQPGDTTKFVLGVFDYEVCGTGHRCFVPVAANATWSVTPADGAGIDPATGILSIDPDTPSGSILTVRADVERGRHEVVAEVNVYTPEANPLIGHWREGAQLACESGDEVVPAKAIQELIFAVDGTFAVTWVPFESYRDYWGRYTYDLTRGTLELTVTSGNTIPPDVDGSGQFAFDAAGRLLLTDLWLGTPSSETGPPNCGHRFGG